MSQQQQGFRDNQPHRGRRALLWEAIREYASGALWVLPGLAAVVALAAGFGMSQIKLAEDSFLARFAFQGTADDARTLLTEITGTVVTVIALVLGLTVVALQLSSTQFSPRLLRNFLRDRGTQVVLSVFIATFVYSAAGLFTVGVEQGTRTEDFPRLAISGAIVLLFASLGMVVYFADHLVHSIQIDAITRQVEKNTRRAIVEQVTDNVSEEAPRAPDWAVALPSHRTGYVQTMHPELLVSLAAREGVTICLRTRVGQHVIAGTTLAWVWAPSPKDPKPDPRRFQEAVNSDVRIGFERTIEQDVGFGVRQLIDIASKALSPAINDPYTAVQAIDHLGVRVRGPRPAAAGHQHLDGLVRSGLCDRTRDDLRGVHLLHLRASGPLRRQPPDGVDVAGAHVAYLRRGLPPGSDRLEVLDQGAQMLLDDAERDLVRPSDLEAVRTAVESLQQRLRT